MPGLEQLTDAELDAIERGNFASLSNAALDIVESYAGGGLADAPAAPEPSRMAAVVEGMTAPVRVGARLAGAAAKHGVAVGGSEQGPATAGALLAGLATGGMAGVLGPAAIVGAGGAGGEALRQAVTPGVNFSGGKIVRRGLENALMDLGIGGTFKVARAAIPVAAQVFAKVPSESVKRALENPALLKLSGNAKLVVENRGVVAIDKIQAAIEAARRRSGIKVEGALRGLERKTGGKPIIDLGDAVEAGLTEFSGRGGFDPVTGELLKEESAFLAKLLDQLPKDGKITARQAVNLRRQLDDLITYKAGGVQKVSSDAGEAVVRSMANRLRQSIGEAADAAGFPALKKANAEHSKMADLYEEMAEIFRTPSNSRKAKAQRFDLASKMFYAGGIRKDILDEAARTIPHGQEAVKELLDAAAARSFTEIPTTAPSNMLFNLFRIIGAPRALGAGIRSGGVSEGAARAAGIGAVNIADALLTRDGS